MAVVNFNNVGIVAMAAAVPKNVIDNYIEENHIL